MLLAPPKDPLADQPLDWSCKGLSPNWEGLTPPEIATRGDNMFASGILWPAATLRRSTLEANRAWMRRFLEMTGARIAPHGKTTLAPELFRQQAEDGAWAITAATAHHVRLYRRFGVARIFLANQLVGSASIDFVLDELIADPQFDFYCLVDSVEGVEQLADRVALKAGAPPLQVLVEMGRPGGRCGVRSVAEGLELAWAVASCAPYLRLVGVETFEGISQLASDGAQLAQGMLEAAVRLAEDCRSEGLISRTPALLSAGGSSLFDLAARILAGGSTAGEIDVVLRCGCYITHDDGAYTRLFEAIRERTPQVDGLGPALAGALRVWAQVQSLPEPGVVVCGLGRRDVGTETDMPRPLAWVPSGGRTPRRPPRGLEFTAMFDQHAVLSAPPGHGLALGDLIGFGVSHPCTTFDKWRTLLLVDDDGIVEDLLRTYF